MFCENLWLWLGTIIVTSDCGWSRWSKSNWVCCYKMVQSTRDSTCISSVSNFISGISYLCTWARHAYSRHMYTPQFIIQWLGDRDCTAQYNFVCPRLLTVGDSVVLFFFYFLSFFLILHGAPAMSLTWYCHLNQYIVTYLLTYLLTYLHVCHCFNVVVIDCGAVSR